jgi:hypothetical protein
VPSTTNLEEEEIVDAPGNDGNVLMPEQVKRPNPWRKMMRMLMNKMCCGFFHMRVLLTEGSTMDPGVRSGSNAANDYGKVETIIYLWHCMCVDNSDPDIRVTSQE